MSEENVDVVRRTFAAFDREDGEAALELFDPEVEWSPTEGTYRGREGVLSSVAEWLEPWEEHHVEVEELTPAGDQVFAVIHLTGRGAGSGMEIDQRFFQLFDVRNGKITRMVEFVRRDEALAAAGLTE